MRVILHDIDPDDFILAARAVKWLMARFQKDVIMAYGERPNTKDFYVRRNKSSITVRHCTSMHPSEVTLPPHEREPT